MTETLPADPFTATAAGARHAAYAELAAAGRVHRITLPTGAPAWLITGYDEARRALTDPRLVRGGPLHGALGDQLPPDVKAAIGNHLLNHNPPDHTRLRRLVGAAFTRRRVEQLAPRIQQIADALLDALDGTVETDLIATFAYPLPMTVICELLGVPDGDRDDFRSWTTTAIAGPFAGTEAYVAAATTIVGYSRELLAGKRRSPTDDLLSALVEVRDGGDRLSEDELIAMVFLLVAAGHETTVNLIGNGVHALLTHPEQLALLRAEPDRLPAVVEELLRFAGPLQVTMPLVTAEPVELGGVPIPAGETVFAGLLAANRDPARVANPAELDIGRAEHSHLAFGHGIHHCLGAPLARLEGRIALQTLLSRFPGLRLAVPPHELTWQPSLLLHGLTTLPVMLASKP
ncbi:MAG: cytochrome P450 family protein [Pseudonocardiaceae bacterium]